MKPRRFVPDTPPSDERNFDIRKGKRKRFPLIEERFPLDDARVGAKATHLKRLLKYFYAR